jgi:hypothetical protein
MPLYPSGDPRRPLQLAVRSMRWLGIFLTIIGVLMLVSFAFFLRRGSVVSRLPLLSTLVYLGPGVLYLLFAIFLARRQRWAVIAGLILASIQAVLSAILFVVVLTQGPEAWLAIAICGLLVAALIQLIFHLSKSFEAIRLSETEQRGFEPLPVQTLPGTWPAPPPPPAAPPSSHST